MPSLRELQRAFFGALSGGTGATDGRAGRDPDLLAVIGGHTPLTAAERLDIYAQMYGSRIVDALFEDFPRVAALLGAARFEAVARAYLACTPSTHPSLRHAGRGFAAFLARQAGAEPVPFLADLARLEWLRLEVFDAPDAAPLAIDEVRALPPNEWPGLRFRPIAALETLRSAWPIHEIWAAAAIWAATGEPGGGEPACSAHPVAGHGAGERWQAAETEVRVWRQGFVVYQASMDTGERLALDLVRAGEPFAAICEGLARLAPAEEAVRTAAGLLLRWVEDGILERAS